MGLFTARMVDKVLSWCTGFCINIWIYFLFLATSMLITVGIMRLIGACTDSLSEHGLEALYSRLPTIAYSEVPTIVFMCISTILIFMLLYSKFVELKFVKPDIKVLVIILSIYIITFYILYWIGSSIKPIQEGSLSELLGFISYIFLVVMLITAMIIILMSALLFQRLSYRNWPIACFKRASSAVDSLAEGHNAEKCLFEWDNIPGEDSEKLAKYLREDYDIDWVKSKCIYKPYGGKIIHVSDDKNSLEIIIADNKEKATLEINNSRIYNLKVKKDGGKLNIYEVNKNMYDIRMVSENYKNGINEVKDLLRRGIDLNRNSNMNQVLDRLAFSMQYYLLYGGHEQIESVKKHLYHITKIFDDQYHINSDQFIYEILRMHGKMNDYFEKNKIHPERSTKTRSTEFVDSLNDHLLKILPKVLALIIAALIIYLIKLPSTILQYFPG